MVKESPQKGPNNGGRSDAPWDRPSVGEVPWAEARAAAPEPCRAPAADILFDMEALSESLSDEDLSRPAKHVVKNKETRELQPRHYA